MKIQGFGKPKPSPKRYSLPASTKHAQRHLEEYYGNKANDSFNRCLAFCCRNQQFLEEYARLEALQAYPLAPKLSAMGYCKLFGLPMAGSTNEDIRDLRRFEEWIQVNIFSAWLERWG